MRKQLHWQTNLFLVCFHIIFYMLSAMLILNLKFNSLHTSQFYKYSTRKIANNFPRKRIRSPLNCGSFRTIV